MWCLERKHCKNTPAVIKGRLLLFSFYKISKLNWFALKNFKRHVGDCQYVNICDFLMWCRQFGGQMIKIILLFWFVFLMWFLCLWFFEVCCLWGNCTVRTVNSSCSLTSFIPILTCFSFLKKDAIWLFSWEGCLTMVCKYPCITGITQGPAVVWNNFLNFVHIN